MLRMVVDSANLVVSVVTGFYLVLLAAFRTEGLKAVPEGMVGTWYGILFFVLLGLALVGFNIYLLVEEWKEGGLRRNLVVTTAQGESELHVSAVEMHILSDLKREPDVLEPMVLVTIRGEGKPMRCDVTLKLRRRVDVITRIDELKRSIRDSIDRLITGGITAELRVEVVSFIDDASTEPATPVTIEFPRPAGPAADTGAGADGSVTE